ncbi:MAG: hypothetical protein QM733_24745 [Ilumatobacteraceae bacterium]
MQVSLSPAIFQQHHYQQKLLMRKRGVQQIAGHVIATFVLCCLTLIGFSQNVQIHGTVKGKNGVPLPNTSISAAGQSRIADSLGNFTIKVSVSASH